MDIQVRTDYHIQGEEPLIEFVKDEVAAALDTFATRLTSVQVHLAVESGARKGPLDIRCMIEARPAGHAPVAVTHHANTKEEAVLGATEEMQSMLDRIFGRADQAHPGAETIRGRGD